MYKNYALDEIEQELHSNHMLNAIFEEEYNMLKLEEDSRLINDTYLIIMSYKTAKLKYENL